VSPNQLDEKLERLEAELRQDSLTQRDHFKEVASKLQHEFISLNEVVNEQEEHTKLVIETNFKKWELATKEEMERREDSVQKIFEGEKKEFLKAIQENMQMLDLMLKEYSSKAQMHLMKHNVLTVSPENES